MNHESIDFDRFITTPLEELMIEADCVCRKIHGNSVFVRGLIEVTNYCTMNCAYCGIRRGNHLLKRYRMSEQEILAVIQKGLQKGLQSFVLQGGVDPEYQGIKLVKLAEVIRNTYGSNFALTFSFGVLSYDIYRTLKTAGVNRYLLRFETASRELHQALKGTALEERIQALTMLKELGYEVGTGFMTGLPGDKLYENLKLLKTLEPDMIGIGPFIPHPETPLNRAPCEGLIPVLRAVSAARIMFPMANIPATTAAGSIDPLGREQTIKAGANVVMPNIGNACYKKYYELYPGKICIEEDGFSCIGCLSARITGIGKVLDISRGNALSWKKRNRKGK